MRSSTCTPLRVLGLAALLVFATSCAKAAPEQPFEPYVPSRTKSPATTTDVPATVSPVSATPPTTPTAADTPPTVLARTVPETPADWLVVADRSGAFTVALPPHWTTVPTGPDSVQQIWAMDLPQPIADAWPVLTDEQVRAFAYDPTDLAATPTNVNVVVVSKPVDPKLAVVPAMTMEAELTRVLGAIDPANLTMSRIEFPGSSKGWAIRAEYDAEGGHFVQYLVPINEGSAVVTLTAAAAAPELEAVPASFRSV